MDFNGARWSAGTTRGRLLLAASGAACSDAAAHGFGQRYDLPVPLSLYLAGAAAAVILSFVIMAAFARTPTLSMAARTPGSKSNLFEIPALAAGAARIAAVALLALVVGAGFLGNPAPVKNIAPIMVWAIWWVGMAYICALACNVWALVNPLDTIFAWMESVYARITGGKPLSRHLRYPSALATWPAVALFFGFAWSELAWDNSDVPVCVAAAVLAYCAITWLAMFLFGRRKWLEHGEAFAIVFSLLGRFAPLELRSTGCRHGIRMRPYAVGLLVDEPVAPALMMLVLLMLATVTFDGLMETPFWAQIAGWSGSVLATLGFPPARAPAILTTAGLAAIAIVFLAVYLACAGLIARSARAAASSPDTSTIARYFVFTLIPIAIGYHLAHYLSFIVSAAQYLIPLLSDPLGFGWDIFGTANHIIRIGIVDAQTVWYVSVAAIVIGHVAAVCLAHTMALKLFGDRRAALRSQYPMLALMVGYTMVSLWIISQPIVASRFG